jgi:hypothetical protein
MVLAEQIAEGVPMHFHGHVPHVDFSLIWMFVGVVALPAIFLSVLIALARFA